MNKHDKSGEKARLGRLATALIVVTGLVWIVVIWAGSHWGWPQRTRLTFDLLALVGFVFAIAILWRLRRAGKNDGEDGD